MISKISVKETTPNNPTTENNESVKVTTPTAENNSNKSKAVSAPGVRKAKMFTSSIALQCDKAELEMGLNCKLEVVKTFHIKKHPLSQDPDLYLERMIDVSLSEDTETDFAVFAVGTYLNSTLKMKTLVL